MMKSPSMTYNDQTKLKVLSHKALNKIDELFDALNISLKKDNRKFWGPCPIHGGDKFNAFNFYHDRGYWKCRTQHCEQYFMGTIIGFIRGVLSHNNLGWMNNGDKYVSFQYAVEFLLNFLNEDYDNIQINSHELDKTKFINLVNTHIQNNNVSSTLITRDMIRSSLKIPAEYYLKRGYSQHILNEYDIGLCIDNTKPMYNRIVVPVYSENYEYAVGFTGRSIWEKCPTCSSWHNPEENCPIDKYQFPKWRHSDAFKSSNVLYNYWRAKNCIHQQRAVIIVESPGNVWRLEEAGIHNSVAIFGTTLSSTQLSILNCSGALTMITCLDNDENGAGQKGAETIQKQCERIYHIKNIIPPKNDIGEMSIIEVKEMFK